MLLCFHTIDYRFYNFVNSLVVVVVVDPTSTLTNYIRLAGGAKPSEGRLEVKGGNQWGTVCDDNFGVEEASAACRTLGYR